MRYLLLLLLCFFTIFTGCGDPAPADRPDTKLDTGLPQDKDVDSDTALQDAENQDSNLADDVAEPEDTPDVTQDVDPPTSCTTSAECTGADSVCDPMSKLCVDCLFDSQCTDGGRCIDRICKTEETCESNLECANVPGKTVCNLALRECVSACNNSLDCQQGNVCDPIQKQCVQCASNLDCGDGERCVASQCEAFLACQSDNQCTPHGLLCDVERGSCNECENDAGCPNSYHCTEGRCIVDVCENNTMRCSGRTVEKCVDGKLFESLEACPFQQSCVVNNHVASCGACTDNNQCATGFECNDGQCIREDDEICPTAIAKARITGTTEYRPGNLSAKPLQTIQFSGLDSEGTSNLTYEWTILTRPFGSKAKLSDNTLAQPELWLDLAGNYEVELVVYDADGTATCTTSVIKISVVPDQEVHIQLTWTTPTVPNPGQDRGTDLDLHYRHPLGTNWNDTFYDIYWKNRAQNWGTAGSPSSASLDIDDRWGETTENINHKSPQAGTYQVGVHYYVDNGYGPADATIRIYIQGRLVFEILSQRLEKKQFWHVADIQWPDGIVSEIHTVACDGTFPGFGNSVCQ